MTDAFPRHLPPIYRSAQIREIESRAATPSLMEQAGLAAAGIARDLLPGGGEVLVLAGPGNNGGDALTAARHLRQWWFKTSVVFPGDEHRLPPDAARALQAWRIAGGELHAEIPPGRKWALIVDGLFGIGLTRAQEGVYLRLAEQANAMGVPVLALDIPSGVNADSGGVPGCALRAAHTVTFIALKPGLLTGEALDYCGKIHLRTLGVDATALLPPPGRLLDSAVLAAFRPRPRNSHKGMFGSAGILGGERGMAGAALLAGRAALKLGAGRVYLGLLDGKAPRVDAQQPELMLRAPHELFKGRLDCLVAGPGLGQSVPAFELAAAALKTALPLVLDADALNLLACDPRLRQLLEERTAPAIVTPHPAEAARLLECSTQTVQSDRIAAAVSLAQRFRCHAVLKGAGSVCVAPDGNWFINPSGNAGLASAGTGDILAGLLGAFLAQGLDALQAMLGAVYLHGAAADELVAQGKGPLGLAASEIPDAARDLLNRAINGTPC